MKFEHDFCGRSTTNQSKTKMDQLPDDVIKYIFGYVCSVDILSLSLTSKENKRAYSRLFYQRFVKDFNKMNGFVLPNNIKVYSVILRNCLVGDFREPVTRIYHPLKLSDFDNLVELFKKLEFKYEGNVRGDEVYTNNKSYHYIRNSLFLIRMSYCNGELVICDPLKHIENNKTFLKFEAKRRNRENAGQSCFKN